MEVWMLLFGLLSCNGVTEDNGYEGDSPGECTDAADNDRDGYFDCDDNGCWNSPDCGGDTDTDSDSDSDADSDADSDTDTDPDLAKLADLTSFTVAYTLTWDFDDSYKDLLEFYGLGDCESHYHGDGTSLEVSGAKVTFTGNWALTDSTCVDSLQSADAVWYDPSGQAFATFAFGTDGATLESWMEHKAQSDTEPGGKNQWYITDMAEPFDWGTLHVHHTEQESTTIEGIIPLLLTHDADFQLAD
jgi:hypothetical protein